MSLLTVVQDACLELSLDVPNTVIGNTDQQVRQLLAVANAEGQYFSKLAGQWGGWPELNTVYTFNLVPVGPFTGTTTAGSDTITAMSSTVGILPGYGVAGAGVYQSATVLAVTVSTVQMSAVAASSNAAVSYNFGQIAYDLPTDIKSFVNATQWDRDFRWPMLGPLSPQEWQTVMSGISPVGPRIRFRVVDNTFLIQPLPGTGQTDQIAYEYISNAWCTDSSGTPRTASGGICRFAADGDLYRWPEDTLKLGIKWRFLRAKGLDYGEEYREYTESRDTQIATSGASRSLRLNATANGLNLLGYDNIPDSGYGT
jgi:hypothetical protein